MKVSLANDFVDVTAPCQLVRGATTMSPVVDHTPEREPPEAAQRVQRALLSAGLTARVVELPASTRTAAEAAAAIGCMVGQIVKSLVFRTETGEPLVVLASGANQVDLALISSRLGQGLAKADADFVRSATGFVIGGVPPIGHARSAATLIDRDLLQFDTVWAAGGTPRTVFSLTPQELVESTGGRVVPLAL